MATTFQTTRRASSGYRLSPALRKSMLVLHVISGIGWMGADVAIFLLLLRGATTDNGQTAAACYIAIGIFIPIAVPVLSVSMLVSGVILGWGTKWGLIRYWWVFVKLLMGILLTVLVFIALVPEVRDLEVAYATGASAESVRDSIGDASSGLFFPPIVSFSMLLIAVVLSMFKPWGKTSWNRQDGSTRRREIPT